VLHAIALTARAHRRAARTSGSAKRGIEGTVLVKKDRAARCQKRTTLAKNNDFRFKTLSLE